MIYKLLAYFGIHFLVRTLHAIFFNQMPAIEVADLHQYMTLQMQILILACILALSDVSSPAITTFTDPQLFEFESSAGPTMYGMIYEPSDRQPGVQYPVVLFVYGGPHVQLVSQNYKAAK